MRQSSIWLSLAVVFALASLSTALAQGPYGGANLPAGVLTVTVEGETLSLVDTPTITERQPTIAGTVDQPAGSTIVLGVASQTPTNSTLSLGAGGTFSMKVAAPLELGRHDVFIDGARVGSFIVAGAGGQQPLPPLTGSGSMGGTNISPWIPLAVATALLGVGGFLVANRRSTRGAS